MRPLMRISTLKELGSFCNCGLCCAAEPMFESMPSCLICAKRREVCALLIEWKNPSLRWMIFCALIWHAWQHFCLGRERNCADSDVKGCDSQKMCWNMPSSA